MAIVRDAQSLLNAAVEATLTRLTAHFEDDALTVVHHLIAAPSLAQAKDDEPGVLVQELLWRLNIYIEFGSRFMHLHGTLPYAMCADGDTLPMVALTENIWDGYQFGHMMLAGNLDEHLEEIAKGVVEAEAPEVE